MSALDVGRLTSTAGLHASRLTIPRQSGLVLLRVDSERGDRRMLQISWGISQGHNPSLPRIGQLLPPTVCRSVLFE